MHKHFKIYLLTFLFALWVIVAQSQVRIKVSALNTGKPLQAKIYDYALKKFYKTNAKGILKINPITEPKRYSIFTTGYYSVDTIIKEPGQEVNLNIVLEKISRKLTEVEVREERDEVFLMKKLRKVEGTAIFSGKKNEVINMNKVQGNIASNNAREIYAQVVGLNIYDNGDAGIQLNIGGRGLDPNRTQNFNTRQNGYDISADVLGYPESYYTPPPEALQEIQIIRGASALQYGTQFGGLINFKFRPPNPQKKIEVITRQGYASYNAFNSFNSISGTTGKLGYYGFYNYKRGDGFRSNSAYQSHNAHIHLDYKLGKKTTLSAEYTFLHYLSKQAGGLTDQQFYENPLFSNRSRNWFGVNWNVYALKLEHTLSKTSRLSINAFGLTAHRKALGFRQNRTSQPDDFTQPRELLVDQFSNFGLESRWLKHYRLMKNNHVMLLGAKYYNAFNQQKQGPGSANSNADFYFKSQEFPNYIRQSSFVFPNQNVAFFTEHLVSFFQGKLTLVPGARVEYIRTSALGSYKNIILDLSGNPILDTSILDERHLERSFALFGLGAEYKVFTGAELYANVSQNYRSVTYNDIRVINPSYQVDNNITDEKGITADLGIRGILSNFFSYEGNVFGLSYNNRIGEVLTQEERINAQGIKTKTGRLVRLRTNVGDAFIYGVETFFDVNIKQILFSHYKDVKCNIFANTVLTNSRYLSSFQTNVVGNQVEFIPFFNAKYGLRVGYKKALLGVQYTYLSSQFSDATNTPQNINENQRGIEGSVPSYGLIDLSFSYTYKKLKFEIGVNNLLNTEYFTRRATGYPGPGIIPAQPISLYGNIQVVLF